VNCGNLGLLVLLSLAPLLAQEPAPAAVRRWLEQSGLELRAQLNETHVWAGPQDLARARWIAERSRALRIDLSAALKLTPRIHPERADVLLGVAPPLQQPALPLRAAFDRASRIIFLSTDASAQEVDHELVHLALAQLCEPSALSLWLEEALADEFSATEGASEIAHPARAQPLDLLELLDATPATHADWLSREPDRAISFVHGARNLLRWLRAEKPAASAASGRDPVRALLAMETGPKPRHGRKALARLLGEADDLGLARKTFAHWIEINSRRPTTQQQPHGSTR
jgi:hypothetical protein